MCPFAGCLSLYRTLSNLLKHVAEHGTSTRLAEDGSREVGNPLRRGVPEPQPCLSKYPHKRMLESSEKSRYMTDYQKGEVGKILKALSNYSGKVTFRDRRFVFNNATWPELYAEGPFQHRFFFLLHGRLTQCVKTLFTVDAASLDMLDPPLELLEVLNAEHADDEFVLAEPASDDMNLELESRLSSALGSQSVGAGGGDGDDNDDDDHSLAAPPHNSNRKRAHRSAEEEEEEAAEGEPALKRARKDPERPVLLIKVSPPKEMRAPPSAPPPAPLRATTAPPPPPLLLPPPALVLPPLAPPAPLVVAGAGATAPAAAPLPKLLSTLLTLFDEARGKCALGTRMEIAGDIVTWCQSLLAICHTYQDAIHQLDTMHRTVGSYQHEVEQSKTAFATSEHQYKEYLLEHTLNLAHKPSFEQLDALFAAKERAAARVRQVEDQKTEDAPRFLIIANLVREIIANDAQQALQHIWTEHVRPLLSKDTAHAGFLLDGLRHLTDDLAQGRDRITSFAPSLHKPLLAVSEDLKCPSLLLHPHTRTIVPQDLMKWSLQAPALLLEYGDDTQQGNDAMLDDIAELLQTSNPFFTRN